MNSNFGEKPKVEVEIDLNDIMDELVVEIANLKRENAILKARNRALVERVQLDTDSNQSGAPTIKSMNG